MMHRQDLWWFQDGHCTGTWEQFFALRSQEQKQVCYGCPVGDLCLYYAISLEDDYNRYGVFGGANPAERTALGLTRETASVYYQEMLAWYRAHRE